MVNKIHLTESVILGSMVTIHQGAEVKSWTTIGNITRIISLQNGTSEADNHQFYLGVPAESVPLTSLSNTSPQHISSGMIKKWKYWLSSTLRLYDGSILSSTQNVIVISIEYRVDSLGFLYLSTPDAPGSQGLFDQQLALEWIHKNIRNFGGYPQRITLFDESAGAVSVGLHLLSPKSRSLFNNAILESSGPTAKWAVLTPQKAKYRSEKFINVFTRYFTERYEAGPNDSEYAYIPKQCQKRLNTIEDKFLCVKNYLILSQTHFRSSWTLESYNGGPIGYTFVPTIDGDFIPYDPEQMLIKKDFKRCPILLDVNKDEGSYFNLYVPYGNMSINTRPYVDYKTFKHAIKEYFHYIPTYPTERAPRVLETDELMLVFGEPFNITGDLHYTNEEVIVRQKMMAYWTNFAKYSNPNQGHDTQWINEWRPYKWPSREHIILNIDLSRSHSPEHGSAHRADYCSFWLDFIPKLTNANYM
ncbi:unnamed protein product [Rotaria sp. Silwood2]|nr:unnamed protein product [Rotaria sp. Silwood2]